MRVLQSLAFFYCFGELWSLSERFLRPISIQTKNPVFSILNYFSCCSWEVEPFQSGPVVKHDFLFTNTAQRQWLSVTFLCIPSWKYRRVAPVLVLTCLFQHLPRPEVHYLSFGWSVFCTSTGVLLNDKARNRSEVAIVLLGSCRASRKLQVSSATTTKLSRFPRKYCNQDIDV